MTEPLMPDPAAGVFETMLVVDGAPIELGAHLSRLRASVRTLYGAAAMPATLAEIVHEQARDLGLGRLRVTVAPGGVVEAVAHPIKASVVLPGWDGALDLTPVAADGWDGSHKWADRRLLERWDARVAPAAALLTDGERGVLETTRANLFAVGPDGVLRTPPTSCRILPGIARSRVLALARAAGVEVREERISTDALRDAREAFTTGSLRGVEPVRSFDGTSFGGMGGVTRALADAVRRAWLVAPDAVDRLRVG